MSASATFLKTPAVLRSSDSIVWNEFPGQRIDSKYPRMWPLLALALAALLFNLASVGSTSNHDDAMGFLGVALFVRMAATCYWLFCMYRLHRILAEFTGRQYPISPGKAVLLQLIPLLGYYWSFHWTRAMARLVNQRGATRMRTVMPGLALATASFLGFMGSLPQTQLLGTLRLFLLFATGLYITKKLRITLPKPQTLVQNRLAQLKVAVSVGIGSAFSFILVRAIAHMSRQEPGEAAHEAFAGILVAIGMVVFLEPAFELLRESVGLAQAHQHAMPLHRPWRIRMAAFAIIALPSISHSLLHKEVEANVKGSFEALVATLLISGGITYCWITAARRQPSCAMRNGALSAAILGTLLFLAWLAVSPGTAGPDPTSRSFEEVVNFLCPWVPSSLVSEKLKFAETVVPLVLFGLAGGFAIDRRRTCCVRSAALAIMAVATASTLMLWLVNRPADISQNFAYMSAGFGWALALVVGPSSEVFAAGASTSPVHS